jgi:zinc transport system ATP-binding protein
MYNLIADLNREGITVIMISHDITMAVKYASHILHIGSHIFFGTRDAYLKSESGKAFAAGEGGLINA